MNAAWVEHTHQVLGSLELLLAAATDSETAERGYVITGDEEYLEPYRQAAAVIDSQMRHLRELTADNRGQQQRLDSVMALVTERLAILRGVIDLRRDQGFAAAQGEILTEKANSFTIAFAASSVRWKIPRRPCFKERRTSDQAEFGPCSSGYFSEAGFSPADS